ncbi:MAG: helix-hairpin-helix domain-containing protein [Acidovorax sp.]|uniref:ComEA family DNA-binding protein n=1 Tax=Acidovorax sp. TaxID=1872122 RepID=UPI0026319171|nr:helix-hairpin-helix domain-containing protein [Acidovorax sp.]MDH4428060.1 helix-hairpin-helix domain-containing protein [Acidovorax sp.]MDH4462885.1 helix-hairpin-helix domain-containing protein [Acidovorax sp.]
MLKRFLFTVLCLLSFASFAAVDVNQATAADLDGIKGIGPGLSGRIIQERDTAPFTDWADLVGRVSGVGEKTAARLSSEGLRVNGKKFSAAAFARAEARQKKADAKAEGKDAGKPAAASAAANPATTAAPSTASPGAAPAAQPQPSASQTR